MNWYVLYCQTVKTAQICENFNKKGTVFAFIPRMEEYMRYQEEYLIKDMFPGYLFIKTSMNQTEFDNYLGTMKEEEYGIIRELRKEDVSALSDNEIELLDHLLDEEYILRMSVGRIINRRAVIEEGPLKAYEDRIIDLDKRNRVAYLDIKFMSRNIKAGLWIRQDKDM